MDIRRLLVVCDTINSEGGLPAIRPVTRVAACAVIRNPLAGVPRDDLGELVPLGAELGELLVRKALAVLPNAPVSYGKAAIVGLDGDIEHAAAILHPRMGKPMREAIGGGKAIIPSNVKVAAAGTAIDVPLSRPRRRLGVRSHRHHHRGRAGRAAAGRDCRGRRARRRRQAAAAHRQGGRAAARKVSSALSSCVPARRDGRGQRPRR